MTVLLGSQAHTLPGCVHVFFGAHFVSSAHVNFHMTLPQWTSKNCNNKQPGRFSQTQRLSLSRSNLGGWWKSLAYLGRYRADSAGCAPY